MPAALTVDETALADATAVLGRMNCNPATRYVEPSGDPICADHGFYWPDDRPLCNKFEDGELAALRLAHAIAGASTAARPEIEAVVRFLHDHSGCEHPFGTCRSTTENYLDQARQLVEHLPGRPEVEVKLEVLREARAVISQYLVTSELWRYERVMWAFAIMLNEIPEDTPEPLPTSREATS